MFNKYAESYDLFNEKKSYKKEIEFVYEWAGRPLNILDIGCGTAEYWKYYPSGTQLVGLEKSKHMIKESRYKNLIVNGSAGQKSWLKKVNGVDCVTALFDVINYIQKHDWWKNLPLKKGGYFIFDILDKKRVDKDGFLETTRTVNGITRHITPIKYDGRKVDLNVQVFEYEDLSYIERHRMYLYSRSAIERFCGDEFEIVDVKPTKRWQTWYKCKRK